MIVISSCDVLPASRVYIFLVGEMVIDSSSPTALDTTGATADTTNAAAKLKVVSFVSFFPSIFTMLMIVYQVVKHSKPLAIHEASQPLADAKSM